MDTDTTNVDLSEDLSEKQLSLHPFCRECGWRKGGLDSWDGKKCKCGHREPTFLELFGSLLKVEDANNITTS